jgi:alpha-tubulin suppressor-like RCC1 family protein
VGTFHVLALSVDGLVYARGQNHNYAVLGYRHIARELLPKPVEALRSVRVGSVAAAGMRSYAVADTGEVWAWGDDSGNTDQTPLGFGERIRRAVPKPLPSLRGVHMNAVVAGMHHTLAVADDGRVYTWGGAHAALGLGQSVPAWRTVPVPTPRIVQAMRATTGAMNGCELYVGLVRGMDDERRGFSFTKHVCCVLIVVALWALLWVFAGSAAD